MAKQKKKILMGIITNRAYLPTYFVKCLFELFEYTKLKGVKADIRTFSSVEVQQMRNQCCTYAVENNYDYVFMLDDDMLYPSNSIIKLLKHNKDFVVGSATQRIYPFFPTQYKKFKNKGFKDKENRVFITKKDKELIKIESSGVVGALIKVSCLKKLKLPYFKVEYKDKGKNVTGSDVYFCRTLKNKGIKLFLDPTINYNHQIIAFYNSFGINLISQ